MKVSVFIVCTASALPAKSHEPLAFPWSTNVNANFVLPSGVHIGWPLSSPGPKGPCKATSWIGSDASYWIVPE